MRRDGRQNVAFAPCVQLFTATVAVAVVRQFVMIWGISFERASASGRGRKRIPVLPSIFRVIVIAAFAGKPDLLDRQATQGRGGVMSWRSAERGGEELR